MNSKHLLKYIVILALLLFAVSAIPGAAREAGEKYAYEATEHATEETNDEATEEETVEAPHNTTDTATVNVTEDATETATVEVTETPTETATVEVTETPTETATVEVTETPTATVEVTPTETPTATVEASPTVTATETVTATATVTTTAPVTTNVTTADDVESAAVPGSFTSQIIAVANLDPSGPQQAAQLALDQINNTGVGNVNSLPVFPGGVVFIRDNQLTSNGEFSGILSSGFKAAAAVLTINQTAKAGDAYPGLDDDVINTEVFALGILNKHSNFESSFYCQNAGTGNATITGQFFKTGVAAAEAIITSASLAPGAAVKWNIGDANIQNQWPGGNGNFGYARFTSANKIACVVHNQRTISPYAAAMYAAVPKNGFQSTNSIAPGIFNGHGSSSSNNRGYKFNTGIALVNAGTLPSVVTVV